MFGDMMKNMEAQQKEMQDTLKQIELNVSKDGINIKANAAREILNIDISDDLLNDKEQLEDMMIVALNEMMQKIAEKEAESSKEMMNKMLPGGLAGLGGMFS